MLVATLSIFAQANHVSRGGPASRREWVRSARRVPFPFASPGESILSSSPATVSLALTALRVKPILR